MPAHRHVEEIGSAAMLVPKRLADVAPEVNLRDHVTHMPMPSANKAPHSGFEIREISPEVQNRGISGPTKRTYVLQKFLKKIFAQTGFCARNGSKQSSCKNMGATY